MPFKVTPETENTLDFVCNQAAGGFDLWADFTTSMCDVEPMESTSNTGHFEARVHS